MNRRNRVKPLKIAVVGTGISGMAASWLLSTRHEVTVYEKDDRIGGHTNTVTVDTPGGPLCVDTGFIVFNETNYPNLVALFDHLGVATQPSDMSFSASLDRGRFEYAGTGLGGLFAQPLNLLRPRMWLMLRDIARFYREAPADTGDLRQEITLGDYLKSRRYGSRFINDHLLPMGAAIWSTPVQDMLDYPLEAFVSFCNNHGLLQVKDRPAWRTVTGGSRRYIDAITAPYADRIRLNTAVVSVRRDADSVVIEDRQGELHRYDHVVIASHADQALAMLSDADNAERRLLSAFRYERNLAILHTDSRLMPKTRKAWSSWNFLGEKQGQQSRVCVTYWMNRLQSLPDTTPLFVTLNPNRQPAAGSIHRSFLYDHPMYDRAAIRAQRMLWNLQGTRRTWFCGAHFGHGFHEDGLQAGLAVAEQLGDLQRPWQVENMNGRIHCNATPQRYGTRRQAA